jgi:hypothetical protein
MSKIETRDFTPWTRDFLIELETRRINAEAAQNEVVCREILATARAAILNALGKHVNNERVLTTILNAVYNQTPIEIELEPRGFR